LATGYCTLARVSGGNEQPLGEARATAVKQKGTYRLRFANVDRRLTVWVDHATPFSENVEYSPTAPVGPTENDLQPASIGVKGAGLTVHSLKLWRDTYYTQDPRHGFEGGAVADWADPATWEPLRRLPVSTIYVQPGHYLCLGDNSPESSDGRAWGLVPERLLLGRALAIYYPFWPFGDVTRTGPIK
jgi:signal peptidase I